MTTSISDSEKRGVKGAPPVMPCHPAEEGGVSGRLARGSTPSTPDGNTSYRKRPESRRMSIKKFFRCTPEEDAVIRSRAAAAGVEQASYLRVQALGQSRLGKARRVRADWNELQRCMGVINKAGNVVNQLVKVLYLGGVRSDIANTALTELCKAARAVMAALGRG